MSFVSVDQAALKPVPTANLLLLVAFAAEQLLLTAQQLPLLQLQLPVALRSLQSVAGPFR